MTNSDGADAPSYDQAAARATALLTRTIQRFIGLGLRERASVTFTPTSGPGYQLGWDPGTGRQRPAAFLYRAANTDDPWTTSIADRGVYLWDSTKMPALALLFRHLDDLEAEARRRRDAVRDELLVGVAAAEDYLRRSVEEAIPVDAATEPRA